MSYYFTILTDPVAAAPKWFAKWFGWVFIEVGSYIYLKVVDFGKALDEAIAMWYWKLRAMVVRSWIGRSWLFTWRSFKYCWAPINTYITIRRSQTVMLIIEMIKPCTILPEYPKDEYGWFMLIVLLTTQYLYWKSSAYDYKHRGRGDYKFLHFLTDNNIVVSDKFASNYRYCRWWLDFALMWAVQVGLIWSHSFR